MINTRGCGGAYWRPTSVQPHIRTNNWNWTELRLPQDYRYFEIFYKFHLRKPVLCSNSSSETPESHQGAKQANFVKSASNLHQAGPPGNHIRSILSTLTSTFWKIKYIIFRIMRVVTAKQRQAWKKQLINPTTLKRRQPKFKLRFPLTNYPTSKCNT